jgi:uncharacterized protein UPF0175
MKFSIEIPENYLTALKIKSPEEAKRRVEEAFAIEAYRTGILSREGFGEWLNLTAEEVAAFLEKLRLA